MTFQWDGEAYQRHSDYQARVGRELIRRQRGPALTVPFVRLVVRCRRPRYPG